MLRRQTLWFIIALLQYSCLESPRWTGLARPKSTGSQSPDTTRRLMHLLWVAHVSKQDLWCVHLDGVNVMANQGVRPLEWSLGSCLRCLLSSGNTGLPWLHFAHFCDSALPGQLMLLNDFCRMTKSCSLSYLHFHFLKLMASKPR